jgi:hypothetical protein
MSTNITEIAFVLDRSGSMHSNAETTVESFNSFLATQQQEHEELPARLTLVLFDTEFDVLYASVPVPEVKRLDMSTYKPDGFTALLDAVGHTIDETGKRLAAMDEKDRPGTVVIAIQTDGLENSSRIYTHHDIQKMIKHQQEVYSWKFLFLGANQDAIATASAMGIQKGYSANYFETKDSITATSRANSRILRSLKVRAMPNDYDQIVREEEELLVKKNTLKPKV